MADLAVFNSVSRTGDQRYWEPFYIGTNSNPYFDERIPYEGGYNKLIQAYTMCLMDYEFAVLNDAFLVHRPGFKLSRPPHEQRNKSLQLMHEIEAQYDLMYDINYDCSLFFSNRRPIARIRN